MVGGNEEERWPLVRGWELCSCLVLAGVVYVSFPVFCRVDESVRKFESALVAWLDSCERVNSV